MLVCQVALERRSWEAEGSHNRIKAVSVEILMDNMEGSWGRER